MTASGTPRIQLYQIAYSEQTLGEIEPGYLVLDNLRNERPDWYEYWPIRRFLQSQTLDESTFYGFFSTKFGSKTQLTYQQVTDFIRSHADATDVFLFSPQPDMGAFFLNVFEQGELFDPGSNECYETLLKQIGIQLDLRSLVMDSRQIVFSNYFVAQPVFWREWLAINELLFATCEGPDIPLKHALTQTTTYPGAAQRKVFLMERAASLLLTIRPQWRTKAANPFTMGWSTSKFREHPIDAYISDALKIAMHEQGYPEYLQAFSKTREEFTKNSNTIAKIPPNTENPSQGIDISTHTKSTPTARFEKQKMQNITVIINNRDLLTWPKKMCKEIERMHGLREIIIIDNGSSNRELLQWYKDCPYSVFFLENLGHQAAWLSGIIDRISTDLYVVTDPDLDLSNLPDDTLIHLATLLEKYPDLEKIGLSLQTNEVPKASPYFNHVNNYEALIQSRLSPTGDYLDAPVDTTFAIYDRKHIKSYKICGARTTQPYTAKHIPWHITTPDEEFKYYLEHADSKSSSYKKFVNFDKKNTLHNLYAEHKTGKVSTKWESYFAIYEKWLSEYSNSSISLLEIGVQNGGSLEIWKEYFKNGKIFLGCDINPAIKNLIYEDQRIQLIVGPASDPETFRSIAEKSPNGFDIIIDDGSHRSLDTISNFINYFPQLKPGGIFIIEDMHCAYWPEYEGGFFNQRSAGNFFKKLFDLVNIEHARGDFTPKQLFQTFFTQNSVPSFLQDNSVYSISAYNSVYIIEKSTQSKKPLLGSCMIVGDKATIDGRVFKK